MIDIQRSVRLGISIVCKLLRKLRIETKNMLDDN